MKILQTRFTALKETNFKLHMESEHGEKRVDSPTQHSRLLEYDSLFRRKYADSLWWYSDKTPVVNTKCLRDSDSSPDSHPKTDVADSKKSISKSNDLKSESEVT